MYGYWWYRAMKMSKKIINYLIYSSKLNELYSNVTILLRIFLILSVSVVKLN